VGKYSPTPSRISFYNEQMSINSEHEKEILFDMNRAFEAGEFIAYYQPKYDFQNEKIIGAEALVRWNHPDKGILEPGYFVPLFERNGFIAKIDLKIFEDVCIFLDKWNKSGKDGKCPYPITISCNLSRFQLYNPAFSDEYLKISSKYQIAPSKIELELTESLMMDNKKRLLKSMNEIKKAGFDISVDDFGSGFSSLALLKDIPASVIKLDKEFFANTEHQAKKDGDSKNSAERDKIIVNSVIEMAKKLSMRTVAEGVEEKDQAEFLRKMGCDIAQGYLFAKPMSEEEFEMLLKENNK
jgi:EAL domain-containing protein (putative c-di-GMP-specific phosphodiesterase class I)